jgi:AraC-like DNA-binding protein
MGLSMSDILLGEVNSERADAFLIEMGGRGLIEVPQSTDVLAYFVLDGSIKIQAQRAETPTTLQAGEYGLFYYGGAHRVYVDARCPSVRGTTMTQWPVGDQPAELKIGNSPPAAKFLSAALRLVYLVNRPHPENPMPALVHLQHDAQHVLANGALVTDVKAIQAACQGPGASAFVNCLMNMHLTHAIRCASANLDTVFKHLADAPYLMSSDRERAVATAVRLLNTHLERAWTVASLAREVAQSRSTFAATFNKRVAMGPMQYLHTVRMQKAAELLRAYRLDLPLFNVARRVGFGSASAFARAFKLHYGLSPRAFGKQAQARGSD